MNRRSFLGGGTVAAFAGGAALMNMFSRAGDAFGSVVQVASAADIQPCPLSISTPASQGTGDLVNAMRAYLREADLLQDFTDAEDFHDFMEHLYRAAELDDEGELAEAYHIIVEDTACHTIWPTSEDQCEYAEAWKLYAHLDALQMYPTDGSVAFETLTTGQQHIIATATAAFSGMIRNIYPTLAQAAWPEHHFDATADLLAERAHELNETLVADGLCILPPAEQGPANAAPATPVAPAVPAETPKPERPPVRHYTGPVMLA